MGQSLLTTAKVEILFFLALFLPLLVQLIVIYLISSALWRFTQIYIGKWLWVLLAAVGVPVHELSHATAFMLTGAGVQRLVLFAPRGLPEYGGATGVTIPRREPSLLSRVSASIAPFFGCSLAAWLVLRFLLPGFGVEAVAQATPTLAGGAEGLAGAVLAVLETYVRGIVGAFAGLQWGDWRTYLALYLAASLGMGAAPSPADFKIFVPALIVLAVLLFPVFALIQVVSDVTTVLAVAGRLLGGVMLTIGSALSYATVFALIMLLLVLALAPVQRLLRYGRL